MSPANVTLSEFLAGESLHYNAPATQVKGKRVRGKGTRARAIVATYRAGDGIYLEDEHGADIGKAAVTDDVGATRAYVNLTRNQP